MVALRENEPQCPSIFQPSLVLHLVMSPWPKLFIWLKPGLGVREVPNGTSTGWAVIPSIFAKQLTTSIFFSILLDPFSYQPAPVIYNCVCMCECVFLSFHRGRYRKERGFGIEMNWESIMRTPLSPCFNLQTNVDDFVSVWTEVIYKTPMCKAPLSFWVHSHILSHWLFLDLKQEKKDVIALDVVCSC